MKLIAAIFALCATQAVAQQAQPTPEQQIATLQAELQATRQQREETSNTLARVIAQANTAIAAMQKQIDDAKPKEAAKK